MSGAAPVREVPLRTCPKCGRPVEVLLTDAWPRHLPTSRLFVAVFGRFFHGGRLPVTCDCWDEQLLKGAARYMLRKGAPYVAAHWCADAAQARELAAKWQSMLGPGFVAWADEPRAEARMSSKATRDAILSGLVRASWSPQVTREEPRERWAQVMNIESMIGGRK